MVEDGGELIVERFKVALRVGIVLFVTVGKLLILPCDYILCGNLADFSLAEIRQDFRSDDIVFDGSKRTMDDSVFTMLSAWADQAEKYRNGEISKEQYDRWRYTFPAEDTTQRWAKVPSQEISDMLVDAFKDKLK